MRINGVWIALVAIELIGIQGSMALGADPRERPIAEVVDQQIEEVLRREGVEPAPRTDDATLLRRLTLDLAGRIPTAAEARGFLASKDPEKVVRLVDRLLGSTGYVRHQADELDAMLMAGARGSLRDYLVHAVGENRAWDRIFRELMLPDPSDPSGKAATAYLRSRIKDTDRLTAEVSATFFGVNISCAQCHDHPLVDDWKQDHFYGMKAFFERTTLLGNGKEAFLAERGFGTSRFKTTEGIERPARMMFLTGRKANEPEANRDATTDEKKQEKEQFQQARKAKKPPEPPRFSARAKLVELALAPEDRDFFAKAIVNRVWERLFGRGLVTPVDQMHSANPPSHPELLNWLAEDTAAHDYDLRRLIRGLVLTRSYARDSRTGSGDPPRSSLFAAARLRPLTAAQLAVSMKLATADPAGLPAADAPDFDRQVESVAGSARSLAAEIGKTGGGGRIGVAEALFFNNSEQVERTLLSDADGRLVARLVRLDTADERVEMAVWNVLGRAAKPDEREALRAYLDQRTDRPEAACRQLVWALLTSPEFRFNH